MQPEGVPGGRDGGITGGCLGGGATGCCSFLLLLLDAFFSWDEKHEQQFISK